MKDFETARALIGNSLKDADLQHIDCFLTPQMGLFIPVSGQCGYAMKAQHSHPSYMIGIFFDRHEHKPQHFSATIYSPGIPHNDDISLHYYAICIEKEYFESCYRLYEKDIPVFKGKDFSLCSDILKSLNMFAFESSKNMQNAQITLGCHTQLITHWIIRSLLGENLDMRAISDDYSVARAQQYMEQHFGEPITVQKLASLGYVSSSGLTHKFKAELGVSPIEYLIEIRIRRAKTMLLRKTLSITQIAMQCGFSSTAHFSSSFLKRVGVTPSEYIQKFV